MVNGKPLKREDLQACAICKRGVASDGNIDLYAIAMEQHVLNPQNIQREHGLEQMFGGGQTGAVLASVMGTNPDLTSVVSHKEVLLCQRCMMSGRIVDIFWQTEVEETDIPEEGLPKR